MDQAEGLAGTTWTSWPELSGSPARLLRRPEEIKQAMSNVRHCPYFDSSLYLSPPQEDTRPVATASIHASCWGLPCSLPHRGGVMVARKPALYNELRGVVGSAAHPDPGGFPEGSRHSHIDSSAIANKCPLHSKEHSSGMASHVFGNPSGSGLLKIPNDRRQKARRPGILAPDNPPPNNVFKKCAEPCSAQSRV